MNYFWQFSSMAVILKIKEILVDNFPVFCPKISWQFSYLTKFPQPLNSKEKVLAVLAFFTVILVWKKYLQIITFLTLCVPEYSRTLLTTSNLHLITLIKSLVIIVETTSFTVLSSGKLFRNNFLLTLAFFSILSWLRYFSFIYSWVHKSSVASFGKKPWLHIH